MKNKNNIPQRPSLERKMEWEYEGKERELKISHARASVLRKQITEAYEILENIRFDYLADTAFREKIVQAKIGLEKALLDFFLDDSYWRKRIKDHQEKSKEQYWEEIGASGSPIMDKNGRVE